MSNFGELLCVVSDELHLRVYYTSSDGQESMILLDNGKGGVLDPEACEFVPMTASPLDSDRELDGEDSEFFPGYETTYLDEPEYMQSCITPGYETPPPLQVISPIIYTTLPLGAYYTSFGQEPMVLLHNDENMIEWNSEGFEFLHGNVTPSMDSDRELDGEDSEFFPGYETTYLEEPEYMQSCITPELLYYATPPPLPVISPIIYDELPLGAYYTSFGQEPMVLLHNVTIEH